MALSAVPKILAENLVEKARVLATGVPASDVFISPANLKNRKPFQPLKFASATTNYVYAYLNQIEDGGFEYGNFAGWAGGGNASVVSTAPNTGSYEALLATSGGFLYRVGPTSETFTIDPDQVYNISAYMKMTGYVAGSFQFNLVFYDADSNIISTANIQILTANQGYTKASATVGPASASPDHEFPAGTVKVYINFFASNYPNGSWYIDDVLFWPEVTADALFLMGHNFWTANATLSLEYVVADTASGFTWTVLTAWQSGTASTFTAPDDNKIYRPFTAPGSTPQAWRLKVVTSLIVPCLGVWMLGTRVAFPEYALRMAPDQETVKGEVSLNRDGQFIQAVIDRYDRALELQFKRVTDTWYRTTYLTDLWPYLKKLLPVVVAWDETNQASDVFFGNLPAGAELNDGYDPRRRTVTLNLEGVLE